MPEGFGKWLCERGRLLLLLDGLDEVADADERAAAARWIEEARRTGHDSHFLVSCRHAGYTDDVAFESAFLELHLRPLDDAQMRAFVTNWYALVERESCLDPEQAAIKASTGATDLLHTLAQDFTAAARVYALTRNPLLLTAICLVHRDRGKLPRARADLYEEAIAVLLARWRSRFGDSLAPAAARQVLQSCAAWLHEHGRTRAPAKDLRETVAAALVRAGSSIDALAFLKTIRDDSGLLTGWSVDEYGFLHLGFQEYLAAWWFRNEGLARPAAFDALAERVEDDRWQEVILLLLALRNPSAFDPFMRAVVRKPGFARWWNAPTMRLGLQESAEPSPAAWLELIGAHDDGVESLEARQVAAARVLAHRWPDALADRLEALPRTHAPQVRAWWAADVLRRSSGERDVITAERGGYQLVRIPGGRFMMGSPEDEEGRWDDESPQHEVKLADFYLGVAPVTNAEYRRFLEANPKARKPEYWGDRNFNQDEQPVIGVSWKEAKRYCEWAGLVLPTEAQWEYACRAGTTTRYWSGDGEEDLARVGWYGGNSGGRLHAVREKDPNPFGLYDMHGNVYEWCEDQWSEDYADAQHRQGDGLRTKPVADADRVIRGGIFGLEARYARSASRLRYGPGGRYDGVGFRPARVIP